MFKRIVIRSYEVGIKFREGEFKGLAGAGTHWIFDPLNKIRVRVVSKRDPWLADEQLDVIVKSGALADRSRCELAVNYGVCRLLSVRRTPFSCFLL